MPSDNHNQDKPFDKPYRPDEIERRQYARWEAEGQFTPAPPTTNTASTAKDEKGEEDTFCLMLPPPNVTGSLHMGHAFQDTLMDILTRYNRMMGRAALWQPGTDHAGIATQLVVERLLEREGMENPRETLGREAFTDRIWQWKAESGGHITRQLRRLGASADWSRECFTMDAHFYGAVTKAFVSLYNAGLIYRGKRLVNWDPSLKTAISDLEVVNADTEGSLYYVNYPFVDDTTSDGRAYMQIATTRPETILADGAIALNPADPRAAHLVGKRVWVPMTDRHIPIIADDYVDASFGSGCVKITPAHDYNDFEVGKRHAMEVINLYHDDATMNENAPAAYQGMERYAARKAMVADLDAAGLLAKVEPHTMSVPKNERTGVVVEPYLTNQWFVKSSALRDKAVAVVREGKIKFVPKTWEKTYFNWMQGLQDWCISRQIWWGHRIPAYYDDAGNVYVAESLEAAEAMAGSPLTQDADVLDTWFSSALWPFATLGWPENTRDVARFFPTSVLVTGFDIIFFWVARMVMFATHFMDDVPFRTVYIHGLVRDARGEKMSKSKGNVLDPIDVIDGIELPALLEKRTQGLMRASDAPRIAAQTKKDYPQGIAAYGCDALRFTFTALASNGRDIRFDLSRCEGYRNFCNKLWNAARWVFANTNAGHDAVPDAVLNTATDNTIAFADQWFLRRLESATHDAHAHMADYRFDLVADTLYQLVWQDFCDWYIEMLKPTKGKTLPAHSAYHVRVALDAICRLLHPIIPHITEEIWGAFRERSIMQAAYPVYVKADEPTDRDVVARNMASLQRCIQSVRTLRAEYQIHPKRILPLWALGASDAQRALLTEHAALMQKVANIGDIAFEDAPSSTLQTVLDTLVLAVPTEGLDVAEIKMRLNKEIAKRNKALEGLGKKLTNPKYRAGAPHDVVAEVERKHTTLTHEVAHLGQQLAAL